MIWSFGCGSALERNLWRALKSNTGRDIDHGGFVQYALYVRKKLADTAGHLRATQEELERLFGPYWLGPREWVPRMTKDLPSSHPAYGPSDILATREDLENLRKQLTARPGQ
jgi:hypothetical protein